MKKINLDEIASEYLKGHSLSTRLFIYDSMINAMREACHQTIEMCAENARLESRVYMVGGNYISENLGQEVIIEEPNIYIGIDKESILSTKSQII